ncbi:hypothetical protein KGM_212422 [Danaus plexippus plexippus]|uniref:Uncharacterized protein n=1 Tax=Danaus plexippus plexippus TaxID=278856 RepID=A0A212EHL6_DANPL|nr:hypothetical protein KGM_212422 [Danaus plexippus plexippus]
MLQTCPRLSRDGFRTAAADCREVCSPEASLAAHLPLLTAVSMMTPQPSQSSSRSRRYVLGDSLPTV